MMVPTKLIELFSRQELKLTQKQAEQLDRYGDLLLDWNQRMNLTAITQPEEVAVKHFLDSALLLAHCGALPESLSLIDVGTGAGFPGLVLAVLKPEWSITLLDSLQKRVHFLETVCSELELANVTCIHSRAEEGGQNPSLREQFDVATARAVANLPLLCEYCLPFVKVGGWFLPMKGTDPQAEGERGEKGHPPFGRGVEGNQGIFPAGWELSEPVSNQKSPPNSQTIPQKSRKNQKIPLGVRKKNYGK